jgi:hypothetical protein
MILDRKKQRFVAEAVDHMFADQALDPPKVFDLPEGYDWQRVNRLLRKLTMTELETFCIGDQEEQMAIKAKLFEKEDGEFVHEALDALFECLVI